jgi:hypothetical protein
MRILNSIYWHPILAKVLIATLCLTGAIWVVFEYVNPPPPSTLTIATGFKGAAYEYFGKQYQERLARAHVRLHVRVTEARGKISSYCRIRSPALISPWCREVSRIAGKRQGCCRWGASAIKSCGYFTAGPRRSIIQSNSLANASP